jgi:hypothetical protein
MVSIPTKCFRLVIVLLAAALNLSMYYNPHASLLNADDLEFERVDREDGPELGGSLSEANEGHRWESFNEWQCFPTRDVQSECTELDSPEIHVPTIRIRHAGHLFDFSMDPEPDMDCDYVIRNWKTLLEGEDSFCVYAAYLQDLPVDQSGEEDVDGWTLWIVKQMKTKKDYWSDADLSEEEAEDGTEPDGE